MEDQAAACEYRPIGRAAKASSFVPHLLQAGAFLWEQTDTYCNYHPLQNRFAQSLSVYPAERHQY